MDSLLIFHNFSDFLASYFSLLLFGDFDVFKYVVDSECLG